MAEGDTEQLLGLLDKERAHRGSVEVFDALLADNPAGVALALARAPLHPLRQELVGWLEKRGYEARPAPEATELRLVALEEKLAAQEQKVKELARELDAVSGVGLGGVRLANAYAAVSVMLFGVAILGWLAAFGVLPFVPERPTPTVPSGNSTANGGR